MINNYSKDIQKIKIIEDLRLYHYERIIRLIYIVMLGRKVDKEALEHLTQALYNGYKIEQIQEDLRNSIEYQLYQQDKYNYPSKIIEYFTQSNTNLEKLTPQGINIFFQLKSSINLKLEG